MNSNKRENNNNEELVFNDDNEILDSPIDLDINNYNFQEMINIFNISPNLNYEDNSILFNTIQDINTNTHNFDDNFIIIIRKIFIILNVIIKYKDYKQIYNSNFLFNNEIADKLIIKIKNIENFEHINSKNLIQLILLDDNENNNNDNNSKINSDSLRENIDKFKYNSNIINYNESNPNINESNPNINESNNKIFNNFNNTIVPGTINAIKRITKFTNLHINTAFRNNYYKSSSTNFIYQLPNNYHNVVSLKLNCIELRHTWLLINETNNFFYIKILDKKHKITLDIINANKDLINEINNKLNAFNNDNAVNIIFNKVEIKTNLLISQFEVLNTNNPLSFIFFEESDNNNYLNTLGWIIGFRISKYDNLTNNKKLLSETFINLNPIDTLYLSINDFQYNYNQTNIICFDKTTLDDHILAKLSISENSNFIYINSTDYENNSLSKRVYNGPINLSKVEVKLYDKFGNILNNKNYDYSFSLQLEILYDNNNVTKII